MAVWIGHVTYQFLMLQQRYTLVQNTLNGCYSIVTTTITKVVEISLQSLLTVQTAAAFMSAFILALHAHVPLVVHNCRFGWV